MSQKWHQRSDGTLGKCDATERVCPIGSPFHTTAETKGEAHKDHENYLAKKHGNQFRLKKLARKFGFGDEPEPEPVQPPSAEELDAMAEQKLGGSDASPYEKERALVQALEEERRRVLDQLAEDPDNVELQRRAESLYLAEEEHRPNLDGLRKAEERQRAEAYTARVQGMSNEALRRELAEQEASRDALAGAEEAGWDVGWDKQEAEEDILRAELRRREAVATSSIGQSETPSGPNLTGIPKEKHAEVKANWDRREAETQQWKEQVRAEVRSSSPSRPTTSFSGLSDSALENMDAEIRRNRMNLGQAEEAGADVDWSAQNRDEEESALEIAHRKTPEYYRAKLQSMSSQELRDEFERLEDDEYRMEAAIEKGESLGDTSDHYIKWEILMKERARRLDERRGLTSQLPDL